MRFHRVYSELLITVAYSIMKFGVSECGGSAGIDTIKVLSLATILQPATTARENAYYGL